MFNCLEANEALKLKFRKLHSTVVNNVNPASSIDFLFQEAVIGINDMRTLQRIKDDPQQQCSELLTLLHASEHPKAFFHLYTAIKNESHLQWLTDRINNCTEQSLIDLLQQLYISEPTGECTVRRCRRRRRRRRRRMRMYIVLRTSQFGMKYCIPLELD